MFDLADLTLRYRPHAEPDDHKHVEGSTADDGARPQLTGIEVMTTNLERQRKRRATDDEQTTNRGLLLKGN